MNSRTTVMITLGGQPQVVTFFLDLLLEHGETIQQVVVMYLAGNARYQASLQKLSTEFSGNRYAGQTCFLRPLPIRIDSESLSDVRSPEEVEAVRQAFHQKLAELKSQSLHLHLGLSGGRRVMSLIALAAAMQYLTPVDRVWHIYTPPDLAAQARDGAIMHAGQDAGTQLIPVPFVPWVAYFPGLAPLMRRSPQELGEASLGWLSNQDRDRCVRVWDSLTQRQRDVLRVLADGDSRQEIAEELGISPATVDSHRAAILQQCSLVWEAQSGAYFDIKFLRDRFGPFLAGIQKM